MGAASSTTSTYSGGSWSGQGSLGKTTASPSNNYPVNNPSFKGTVTQTSKELGMTALETAISYAKIPAKYKIALELFSKSYDLLSFYISSSPDSSDLEEVKKKQQEASDLGYTLQNKVYLQDYLTRQQDAISTPLPGETLPSVLTSNTKSLVSSINTLTSTFSDKFDYFNNYVYGILTYMDSMVGFMDKAYTLAKDQADYEKKKEDDNMIEVDGKKMSPAEIEAKKNYAMWKNYSFQTSPVSDTLLQATEVMGMTPLQIQASKYSYDVESSVYNMTPTTVKDWDDNILADISPREAQHVKNSVVAINQTDEKNVELDDDDVDIMSPIDVSAMFGLPDLTQPFKVVMDEMTR